MYDRLNVLGVTMSYNTSVDMVKSIGLHFKDQLITAVKNGKRVRLIGDNLNFEEGVSHESMDDHKHNVHMFSSCVLVSELTFQEKSDHPEIPLPQLQMKNVLLSTEEYKVMRDDLVIIVAQVLKKYLPQVKFHMESVPDKVGLDQEEFTHKTGVIPLPVLDLNENCEKDTIKILDFYEELVKELPRDNDEPVQIGGDQLTRERFGTSMKLRLGNLNKRFANLGPTTFEFFHLGMNFLEKIVFEPLWSTEAEELGTLYGEKERISRDSVNTKVQNAYEADKDYFVSFTSSYLVEAALDFFQMDTRNDYPTKNKPLEGATPEQQKSWCHETLSNFIDIYCFPCWSGNDNEIFVENGKEL